MLCTAAAATAVIVVVVVINKTRAKRQDPRGWLWLARRAWLG